MLHHYPWIGYGRVEQLADNTDPGKTVYIKGTSETQPSGRDGVATRIYSVRVSHLTPEAVHYVEIRTGRILMHANGPFEEEDAIKAQQRTDDAEELVAAWLRSKGFRVINAIIAEPKDIKLLSGGAHFMKFDEETGRIVAAE